MGNADLRKLSRDLRKSSENVRDGARKVTSKTALQIKKHASLNLRARDLAGHLGAAPYAINYDVSSDAGGIHAEVGFDKSKRMGALGNLTEFGSENNPAGNELGDALNAEEDAFYYYLDALAKPLG